MSSSSDSSCSASSISESETMNSSSEIVGVSSSLQLETVLDDSFSEGDWETGFIFLSGDNFLKMILGESMRAKGKDFAGKQRGMNLEICHFKTFSN